MKFSVSKGVLEKFPELNIGIVIAKKINNEGESEEVMKFIREKENEIRKNFNSETLSQNQRIEIWREVYSSFGAKPKKYKCSVENLYRMILDGMRLKHINKVVDIYNYISIKYVVPVGGDDIDKVDGDIELKLANGNEIFRELNSEELKNPKLGEVVYVDEKEVLCRRWNWRECDKTKMTEDTKNLALVIEGLPPVTRDEIEKIISELGEMIKKFCGGEITAKILSKDQNEAIIA
ncbi:MAG: hypothetical protein COY38_02835 [Candidatus Aenigmarchaeota archaeon CG_4_10_14_0_8_um_filter_37_24]|nr:MAG: hypothetical protein AUJ50_05495 [Candidatus Aenigmarchaeota archaeon CG1_02_38_14]PIV67996.1 MAG: hypothetical protein COS07_05570 [Candidatus Aenigmarchaeota archaeon CG01_land_8_20_14_3_00_37_9]PIZ35184.1 MAG: hypothetical protein COY38_02835 [Candidatus Aenigmarchaeota archaeon CG_4_10_14_0_8_um_filter_37_24]